MNIIIHDTMHIHVHIQEQVQVITCDAECVKRVNLV